MYGPITFTRTKSEVGLIYAYKMHASLRDRYQFKTYNCGIRLTKKRKFNIIKMKFLLSSIVLIAVYCVVCEADVSLLTQQGFNGQNLHQKQNHQQNQVNQLQRQHQHQNQNQNQQQQYQNSYRGYPEHQEQPDFNDFHYSTTSRSARTKGSGYKYEKPSQPIVYPSEPSEEYLPASREPMRPTTGYLPPNNQQQEYDDQPQSLEYLPPNGQEQDYQQNDIYQGPGETRRTNKHVQ